MLTKTFLGLWSVLLLAAFVRGEISNIRSTGGTGGGALCVFPFIYRQRRYDNCTKIDNAKPWCANTPDYDQDQKWGDCADKQACYYVLWVKTSNITDAGTRNPVKIRFSSGEKTSPWAMLKHANIREFKAGRMEKFTLSGQCMEQPCVELLPFSRSTKGACDAWHLASVFLARSHDVLKPWKNWFFFNEWSTCKSLRKCPS